MHRVHPMEATGAHAGAILSRLCVRFPNMLGKHIIGLPDEQYRPLAWRTILTHLNQVEHRAEYTGDPEAGSLPKDYSKVAVTSVPKETFNNPTVLGKRRFAEAAIAWAYGGVLLAAPIPKEELETTSDTYDFAMRVGPGPLTVVAGLLVDKNDWLYDGKILAGEVIRREDLPPEIPLH